MTSPATPPPDHFDPQALRMLHRVGGETLVRDMVRAFGGHASERIAAARAALAVGDAGALRASAHALKSSAGQLGAVGLQQLCQELESAAARPVHEWSPLLDAAEAELARAARWLEHTVRTL